VGEAERAAEGVVALEVGGTAGIFVEDHGKARRSRECRNQND
jgi:hypothetical protein